MVDSSGYESLDAQQTYSRWLANFNLWLETSKRSSIGVCARGACTSRMVESVQKRQVEYEPLAWQSHIAKKACCYLKERRVHQMRGCDNCERCQKLAAKLSRLPLSQIGLEHLNNLPVITEDHVAEASRVAAAVGRGVRQRILEWRADMLQSILTGSAAIYQWLKHGAESLTILVEN
eukprot:6475683-Amphidinium_carterae.1